MQPVNGNRDAAYIIGRLVKFDKPSIFLQKANANANDVPQYQSSYQKDCGVIEEYLSDAAILCAEGFEQPNHIGIFQNDD